MKTIFTSQAPAAIGPYSQAKEVGGFIFISGQLGIDPTTGKLAEGGVKGEATQSCKNIDAILKEVGLSAKDVIKTTCFLTDMKDFPVFNEVYGAYFTEKPARSCIEISKLPAGGLCEIEVIAAR